MISLHIGYHFMDIKLKGSDSLVLDQLSTAAVRILRAMERCNGNPAKENLTVLILQLLEKSEQENCDEEDTDTFQTDI